ncbi:MAG: VIT1/CCC1 transporter family protein [Parachlamydia sp.]|jgi:hypothetical protein|nr:VIT1/CCC1 transporter family protein [Parachlamydia sp.]
MGWEHFKGKTAFEHVSDVKNEILIQESHAADPKKSTFAVLDAARETMVLLLLLLILSLFTFQNETPLFPVFVCFLFGWTVWKMGRCAWLAWAHLEKLHRLLEEEKFEIEHNRSQEREELKALYASKGFQGDLLEEVVDVLMADGNRLLKVMVEEELGLPLESYEHPIVQSVGAGVGSLLAGVTFLFSYWMLGLAGALLTAGLIVLLCAYASASFDKNRMIPAFVWNLSITALPAGSVYFLLSFLRENGWLHG